MSLLFDPPIEVIRPWGKFIQFTREGSSIVKILTVNAGEAFSLQYHKNRDELWYIISGNGIIEIGESQTQIEQNKHFFVPRGIAHRIFAGETPVMVLEIAEGEFDENDIVRLEDRYGRTST